MKKRISAFVASCLLLGSIVMPVQAEEAVSGEAYSKLPQEVYAVAARETAVLPEGLDRDAEKAASTYDVDIVNMNEYEWSVLYLTNKIRMENGLEPLSVSSNLQQAAGIRKEELKTTFDHVRPDGSAIETVLDECGVKREGMGENIAAGMMNPVMAVEGWWNSQGHRENMLRPWFTHMGVGYSYAENDMYGHYWVQVFTGNCTPDAIRLSQDNSIPYILTTDQTIDELGLELTVDCSHGTSYMPVIEEMCSPVDMSLVGQDQTITVSYGGQEVTVIIRVQEPMPFVDVDPNGWYYGRVSEVYYNGIMTGLNETYFGPAEPLARAQFAVILHRLMSEPQVEYTDVFPDVKDNEWYTQAILWANKTGVVTGYTDTGLFGTGDNINREQMAVMMYRFADYLGLDTSGRTDYSYFTDASSVNEFAQDAMSWAVYTGIITGKDNGARIDPQGNANRAECATIIMRFLDYSGI